MNSTSEVPQEERRVLGKRWDLKENEISLEEGGQSIYKVREVLGAGSYGTVFRCKLKLGEGEGHRVEDAVVKCENLKCDGNDGYEIGKWKKIPPHDNLVKFYGGKVLKPGDSQNFGALLVFEKMDCNLEQLMFSNKAFAESCTYGNLVNILQQIVQGLIHIHNSDFLHMDLSLKNLLVKESRNGLLVKIGDFGESKAMRENRDSATITHRGCGPYMAPELLTAGKGNKSSITEHVDVYSLGIVMCALFNKEKPGCETQGGGAVGREIVVGHFQSYKVFCQAPLELCDLIEKCLRFQISHLHDSRNHGRPSFEEILSTLKKLESRKWLSQKIQSKVAEHHASAPMEDRAGGDVDGTNSAPRNSCAENGGASAGAGTSEASEETKEYVTAVAPGAENSSDPSVVATLSALTAGISLKTEGNLHAIESIAGSGAQHHTGAKRTAQPSNVSLTAGGNVTVTDSALGNSSSVVSVAAEGDLQFINSTAGNDNCPEGPPPVGSLVDNPANLSKSEDEAKTL